MDDACTADHPGRPGSLGTRPPVIALVGAAKHVFARDFAQRMADTPYGDVTLAHSANVLRWLHAGPMRPGALAARCDVSKQAISQQIQRLEAQGYVTTCPDPGDQRGRLVALTDRGRAAQDAVHDTFRRVEAAWAERLGAARYDDLRAALATLTGMPHDG